MPGAATGTQGVLRGRVWAAMCQLLNICLWQRGKCIGAQITGPKSVGIALARMLKVQKQTAYRRGPAMDCRHRGCGREVISLPMDPLTKSTQGRSCGQCANFCSSCCETANLTMALTASRKTNAGLAMVELIWSRRVLLCESVLVSLRQRFAGSTLGIVWFVLGPAILLMLYAMIYLLFFGFARPTWIRRLTYSTFLLASFLYSDLARV